MRKTLAAICIFAFGICVVNDIEASVDFSFRPKKSEKTEIKKSSSSLSLSSFQDSNLAIASSEPNTTDIIITAGDNCINIRTPKRVLAKVYTILGQLVTQEYVGPGNSSIQSLTRGIYIVKVGALAQRVTL